MKRRWPRREEQFEKKIWRRYGTIGFSRLSGQPFLESEVSIVLKKLNSTSPAYFSCLNFLTFLEFEGKVFMQSFARTDFNVSRETSSIQQVFFLEQKNRSIEGSDVYCKFFGLLAETLYRVFKTAL